MLMGFVTLAAQLNMSRTYCMLRRCIKINKGITDNISYSTRKKEEL